jgi:PEGA domain
MINVIKSVESRVHRIISTSLIFGSVVGLLVSSGCASIFSGTTQQVAFDSNPAKADVYVNGSKVCVTPCVTVMQRSKMVPRVEIKKVGYEDAQVPVMSRFNYIMLADFFWAYSSTTAFAIDLASHDASVEYDPNRYFTVLEPINKNNKSQSHLLRYVLSNHDQLVVDISHGSGEYLAALYDLGGVGGDKEAAALANLKNLSLKYSDTLEFARAVEKSM